MTHKHTMKVVARRTGLSPHLIRMWERRYKAVFPERTPSGHRLFSEEDIERLILLHRATLSGESIGQIARLSLQDLAQLASVNSPVLKVEPPATFLSDVQNAGYHLNLCEESIRNLDSSNLEARLLRASIALGQHIFLEKVLQPLLVHTGELWNNGTLKVSHEHLASAVVRSLLGSMVVTSHMPNGGPVFISTTPPGQLHEFGALMAAVTAASMGWNAVYLGPNLPAEDIAAAALQRNAKAVALSIIYPSDDPHLHLELKKLSRLLGPKVKILIGGRQANAYAAILEEIGAIVVSDLNTLKITLTGIRSDSETNHIG